MNNLARVAIAGALLLLAGAVVAPTASAVPQFEPSVPDAVCVTYDGGDVDEEPDQAYCVGAHPHWD
jgi:hypothetical protein